MVSYGMAWLVSSSALALVGRGESPVVGFDTEAFDLTPLLERRSPDVRERVRRVPSRRRTWLPRQMAPVIPASSAVPVTSASHAAPQQFSQLEIDLRIF